MPSTITSFYTFTRGVCVASEMNTNFSNFRGDLVPIEEDTAAASNESHDLGTPSHYWSDLYVNNIYLKGSTSTTDVSILPRTDLTTGGLEIKFGSNTIGTYTIEGLTRKSLGPMTASSSDPGVRGFSYADTNTSINVTSTTSEYTVGSVLLTLQDAGLVEVGMTCQKYAGSSVTGYIAMTGSSSAPRIRIECWHGQTTSAMTMGGSFQLGAASTTSHNIIPPSMVRYYFAGLTAGSTIFEFRVSRVAGNPVVGFNNVRLYAFER